MISTQRVNIYDELHVSTAEWYNHYVIEWCVLLSSWSLLLLCNMVKLCGFFFDGFGYSYFFHNFA